MINSFFAVFGLRLMLSMADCYNMPGAGIYNLWIVIGIVISITLQIYHIQWPPIKCDTRRYTTIQVVYYYTCLSVS